MKEDKKILGTDTSKRITEILDRMQALNGLVTSWERDTHSVPAEINEEMQELLVELKKIDPRY